MNRCQNRNEYYEFCGEMTKDGETMCKKHSTQTPKTTTKKARREKKNSQLPKNMQIPLCVEYIHGNKYLIDDYNNIYVFSSEPDKCKRIGILTLQGDIQLLSNVQMNIIDNFNITRAITTNN